MKTQRNIFIAFVLNLSFSVFEIIGGLFTGSVAILSDAVHDVCDALSIGLSLHFEKLSHKQPDDKYTYGYLRYSVLGGFITTSILLTGSVAVLLNAVKRLFEPQDIDYNGMIAFALVGVSINLIAAFFTREGDSINQKAVNLHMLEDVFGWIVVLAGAVVMRFTGFALIDSLMSVGVSAFIIINAFKNLKSIVALFLEKTPSNIDIVDIRKHLCDVEGVIDVHHIHIRSIDGERLYATMHIVMKGETRRIKEMVRRELEEHGICHSTLELEYEDEHCDEKNCHTAFTAVHKHHHHH